MRAALWVAALLVVASGSGVVPAAATGELRLFDAKLTPPQPVAEGWFGRTVALSGRTALVGNAGLNGASAHLYLRTGEGWGLEASLTSPSPSLDGFGTSVAVSGDTALIGAPYGSVGGVGLAGAVHVYTRAGGTWTRQATLTSPTPLDQEYLGYAVSLSDDTAVVGGAGWGVGKVHVFRRTGSVWSHQGRLVAPGIADGDGFGLAVAVSGDTAVVGALSDDPSGVRNAGSAHVFSRAGANWTHRAELRSPALLDGAEFGNAVSLYGHTAVVGAHHEGRRTQGSAHVFTLEGAGWGHRSVLQTPEGQGDFSESGDDHLGSAVAVWSDTIVATSPDDDAAPRNSGSAHVFRRVGDAWLYESRLAAPDPGIDDAFGASVALDGATAVFGAAYDDLPGAPDAGSVYIRDDVSLAGVVPFMTRAVLP